MCRIDLFHLQMSGGFTSTDSFLDLALNSQKTLGCMFCFSSEYWSILILYFGFSEALLLYILPRSLWGCLRGSACSHGVDISSLPAPAPSDCCPPFPKLHFLSSCSPPGLIRDVCQITRVSSSFSLWSLFSCILQTSGSQPPNAVVL